MKIALNIERGIFNCIISRYINSLGIWNDVFERQYIARSVIIYNNLNPDSHLKNVNLIKRLLNKEFDEYTLTQMNSEQLFPERHNELFEKYGKEWLKDVPIPRAEQDIPDGINKCPKCKSYKTEYNEMQTRSADEPTTKSCFCYNCNHRWRFC